MKIILFVMCLLSGLMSTCDSTRNNEQLTGVKWIIESLDGKKLGKTISGNEIFIQFNDAEKRVSGLAGCNRFFGGYEQDGKKLKFSHMGATRMACPDMNTETSFFQMLENTDGYSIKDHILSLSGKGKVLATFKSSVSEE